MSNFVTNDSGNRRTFETGAVRDRAVGKGRYDLLSPLAIKRLADLYERGAIKYSARNWEKGIKFSRVYGAALRHLLAWWDGEDFDPETGESHLDHAACCVHFLSHYVKDKKYKKFDDRPTT